MKMQKYIRILLSLVLIISNLSVAFSMHFCQGQVEKVQLNHLDNKVCKMQQLASCCETKQTANHCKTSKENNLDEDCCKDLAYAEDFQDQIAIKVFKISPIDFFVAPTILKVVFPLDLNKTGCITPLDFYIESNAPPIYILHKQLVLYEA
ncbi:MAG: hypothetical protein KBS93_07825 [Flavobacteriaceae bacterium]|nr:hypothetical protein [Candidatus Onthonaster equi]